MYTLAIAAVVALFAIIGSMDYADQQNEASEYTSMVCAGHWPDYEQLEPDCHGKD